MFFCTFKKPKTKKTMESLSIGLRNFMGKKLVLSLIFLLSCVFLTAQEKGIILKKENSKKTVFLEENRRVKIITKADKKIIGNFTVLDNKTIVIKNEEIAIDSIETISSHSKFSSVANPVLVGVGAVFIVFGTAGIAAGSYGVLLAPLIPAGLPMVLVPVLSNKHKSKDWKYQIVN
jgi:hypothetical protein